MGKQKEGRKVKMSKQRSRRIFAVLLAIGMLYLMLSPINTFANTKTYEQQSLVESSVHQKETKDNQDQIESPTDSISSPDTPLFSDVQGHWAAPYIEEAASLGLFNGYEDGTFKPDALMTRVQAVSVLVRLLGLTTDEPAPFKDIVNFSKETQVKIATAYKYGIIQGSTEFKPNDPVTRVQLALSLKGLYNFHYGKEYVPTVEAPFLDIEKYDEETQNAIIMLYELKIVSGNNGYFMPEEPATRAHIAKIFVKITEIISF